MARSPATARTLASNRIAASARVAASARTIINPERTIVLLSGTSWVVPADWNNNNNTVEAWGAGGGGADGANGSASFGGRANGGGAGGAYAVGVNLILTPGASIPYSIGQGGPKATSSGTGTPGGDTTFDTNAVVAKGGLGGQSGVGATVAIGGLAASCIPTTGAKSGGNGGLGNAGGGTNGGGGGGAGGAGGPSAAGSAGSNGLSGGAGRTGGAGGNGGGPDGGTGNATPSGNGGAGTTRTSDEGGLQAGAGGGGAGGTGGTTGVAGGNGGSAGNYGAGGAGGGGGGSSSAAGGTAKDGAQGCIVIRYFPVTPLSDGVLRLAVLGQSNAVGLGDTLNDWEEEGDNPASTPTAMYLSGERGVLSDPTHRGPNLFAVNENSNAAGSCWPIVARLLLYAGVGPVEFVFCAKGGTSIGSWRFPVNSLTPEGNLLGAAVYLCRLAGPVDLVLFEIGETDAKDGTAGPTFTTLYTEVADRIKLPTHLACPVMISTIQHCDDVIYAGQDTINDAIVALWGTGNIVQGPDLRVLNAEPEDDVHILPQQKQITQGRLWAEAILTWLSVEIPIWPPGIQ